MSSQETVTPQSQTAAAAAAFDAGVDSGGGGGVRRRGQHRVYYRHRHRGARSRRHGAEPGNSGDGRAHGIGGPSQARRDDRGSGAARQRPGIRGDADLCSHQRLPEELVFRYRRARQSRRTAGRDRDSRSGSPTGPGARRPGHRPGQLRSLARPRRRAINRCSRAIRWPSRTWTTSVGDLQAKKAMVDSATFNVRRLEETQRFPKGLCPVRRRDHGAQHRYRRADQRRQQCARQGVVRYRRHQAAARLRQCAAGSIRAM